MEPRAGVALWNITDSLDRVYHESRRSSPIRWSVESVDGNVNKTDQKRRPVPHHFVFERVGSQITGCSNLYPLNASQSVSKIWLLVFTVSCFTVNKRAQSSTRKPWENLFHTRSETQCDAS
jgi:hypothetical protein